MNDISPWNRLYQYRDLLLVFIWREFTIRYKQSLLGVLWAVLQPFIMMLLFTFIFTFIMPQRITAYPTPLFFYAALVPWMFFASSVNQAIPSLVGHYNLITKIYFPREILPLSGIALAFIDFVIATCFLFGMIIFYGLPLTLQAVWYFPLVLLLILFTLSVCLVLSALNVYYRDVNMAISFLVQLWFFATPVFYTIDAVPDRFKVLLFLNPLTFIVENIRRCLLEGRPIIWWQFIVMLILIVAGFTVCYRFFRRIEKRFADVI